MTENLLSSVPPLESLYRLALALGVGLFIGLEREWRGKEAGLRTFGFAAMIGALGGLLGEHYALLSVLMLGVLIFFLNYQSIRLNQGSELTTSAALLVTGLTGVLCGLGQNITPAAIAVVTAGLLAWKERLAVFSHKLTAAELRSAILLAILTFAIFPALPNSPIDPWNLIVPRAAWTTVILIASIGFVNYLLWKIFGANGIELTGFLGGLVNSTVAVTELAVTADRTEGRLNDVAYRGVLLATAAMALRNGVVVAILAISVLSASLLPLALILCSCAAFVWLNKKVHPPSLETAPPLPLSSPFSFFSALKFGALFLILQVVGTIAQETLGKFGFYAVTLLGGFVSSASAVASAATLAASGRITPSIAASGTILASVASALMNLLLVVRISHQKSLNVSLTRTLLFIIVLAIAGTIAQSFLL